MLLGHFTPSLQLGDAERKILRVHIIIVVFPWLGDRAGDQIAFNGCGASYDDGEEHV